MTKINMEIKVDDESFAKAMTEIESFLRENLYLLDYVHKNIGDYIVVTPSVPKDGVLVGLVTVNPSLYEIDSVFKQAFEKESGFSDFESTLNPDKKLSLKFKVNGFMESQEAEVKLELEIDSYSLPDTEECCLYIWTKPDPDHGDARLGFNYAQMKLLREYLDIRIKQVEKAKSNGQD